MGMSSNSSDGGSPVSEINVTPLVDVMLVLLIIFMVTAPMMQQGVDVDLPKTATKPLKSNDDPVVLSVNKEGKLFIGQGNEVPLSQVGVKASAVLDARKEADRKIYIKADKVIPYGKMMEVMAELHKSGITQIGLVSGAPEPDEAK
jgi:biopolymer transport protein TolR